MKNTISPRRRKVLLQAAGFCTALSLVVLLGATVPAHLGANAAASATHTTSTTGTASPQTLAPSGTAHGHPASPVLLGPIPGTQEIAFSLVLSGQNATTLATTLAAISNPASPQYHQYLTPAQYASEFGPTQAARAQAEQFLRGAGFTITDQSDLAPFVQAQGTAAQIQATFGAQLLSYRGTDGTTYMQPATAPHLPQALTSSVRGVLGLDTRHLVHTQLAPNLPSQISGVNGLGPSDLAKAYDIPAQSSGLNGTGVTIALAEIDTVDLNDIAAYDQKYSISAPQVQVIKVNGGTNTTSPEPALDIEVLHAVAPKATILDYEGKADFASLARVFSRIVSDRKAQIVSISLGVCEPDLANSDGQAFVNSIDSTFQQADAEGMTVLVASGDNGAYGCGDNNLAVAVPASNPNVTAVGGTALFLNSDSSYNFEAGWEGPLEQAGTGGGVSEIYSQPSWQSGVSAAGAGSTGQRLVPDVSADADPLTGYDIYYSGGKRCPSEGCFQVVGGTSAAAPFWAGLIALADQRAKAAGSGPLGFINPTLYAMANSTTGTTAFHDVTRGGNLYYQCNAGWDAATGLGTPDAAVLLGALAGGGA